MLLNIVFALFVAFAVVGVISLLGSCVRYRRLYRIERDENQRNLAQRKMNLPVDLELATSEQLLGELRSRNILNYITLWPTFQDEGMTLKMEVHNVDPIRAVGILKVAAKLTVDEISGRMRRNRMEPPDEFPFQEVDDE